MKIIDYKQIENNLDKLKRDTILVLKDDAYGFGLPKVAYIAYKLGFTFFALSKASEALFLLNRYPNIYILMLGKEKMVHKRVFLTLEDESDYMFMQKHNQAYHIKVLSHMNRFGTKEITKYATSDLFKGIYYHMSMANIYCIEKELLIFEKLVKKYNNRIIHIGGSNCLKINHPYKNRIGFKIYENALSLKGQIIKIFLLKKGLTLGYEASFIAKKDVLVGIVDVGYNSGLLRDNKNKYVIIKDQKYDLIGYKCMDYSFLLVDKNVKVRDEVIFLGHKLDLETLAFQEGRSAYELMITIK